MDTRSIEGASRRRFLKGVVLAGLCAAVGKAWAAAEAGMRKWPATVPIHGFAKPGFEPVRDLFAASFPNGDNLGASAAIFVDGEPVLDLWGGHIDPERTKPWETDTIVNNFSTTKTMTALAATMLVDRREIDLDAPVAKYWPEFRVNGKQAVKVRHLLGFTAGLPGWTDPVTVEDILDRGKSDRMLAAQAPWWEPGTAIGYHSITIGPLLGELVRRVTGQHLGKFFAAEIARPLGADYHIGTGPELDSRVSPMTAGTPPRPRDRPGSIPERVFFNPYIYPETASTVAWRRAELGGSNGHGNARSVAAIQSVVSCGGEARGVRLLSREGCERILEPQSDGMDQVLGMPMRWGLGYAINSPLGDDMYGRRFTGHRIAMWGGSGGSVVFNDLDRRMTVAFVMNRHVEGLVDMRGTGIVIAAADAFDAAHGKPVRATPTATSK
jgi:CubicO group peptidase (beta-lactamase class C family)